MRLGTGINIYQYVYVHEFTKWVEFMFVDGDNAYAKLIKYDYIESGMGSRYTKPIDIQTEIDKWFSTFLDEFELDEIQLNYGN